MEFFITWFLFGIGAAMVANSKGGNAIRWFFLGVIFWPVWIIVFILFWWQTMPLLYEQNT